MESSTKDDRCVMSIIAAALRRPPTERELYLRLACAEDRELYRETMEAVRWEERMGNFLQHPLITFKDFGPPFRAGQNIAERFEILRELGEGGMGIVYEAFDHRRKTRIAIKAAKPGFQRLLSPELEGQLKLRHPKACLVDEIHTAPTSHGDIA